MQKVAKAPIAMQPYRRVPNLNLAPAIPRRKPISSQGRIALVFIVVGITALAALLLRQNADQSRLTRLNAEYQSIQAQLSAATARKPEVDRLLADIAALQQGNK